MVATRSKKVVKHSYAERVLGAYSQAQKEHRRQNVHLATLRSQVRKIADFKKDKLGPQWAAWVTRAVHKLEDQGIFQPLDSTGYVSMTSEGKKAVSVARRKYLPSPSASSSPAQEDAVWKSVTEELSVRGQKRKGLSRPTSRPMRSVVGRDRDAEFVEHAPSISQPGGRAKRRRMTSSQFTQSTKSLSNMTKAELKAKVEAMQRAQLEASLPSDNSSNEELQRLQDELRQKDNQLLSAIHELDEMKRTTVTPEDGSFDQGNVTVSRPETPVPSFDTTASSPSRPHSANMLSRPVPLNGVTRTQSGSIISHISKQPTPAPSSPGMAHDDIILGMNDDDDVFMNSGVVDGHCTVNDSYQVATPAPSPVRSSRDNGRRTLEDALSTCKRLGTQLRSSEEHERALQGKIMSMEETMQVRLSEQLELQNSYSELQSKHGNLETSISKQNEQVDMLNEKIANLQHTISERSTTLETKESNLSDLREHMASLERSIAEKEESALELKNAAKDQVSTIARLEAQVQELTSKLAGFDLKIQDVDKKNQSLMAENDEARKREETLSSSLELLETESASLRAQISAVEKEKQSVETQYRGFEVSLETSRAQNAVLEAKISDVEQNLRLSKTELTLINDENSSLISRLVEADEFTITLKKKAADITDQSATASAALEVAQTTIQELQNRIESLEDAATQTNELEKILTGRIETLQDEKENLEKNLEVANRVSESLEARSSSLDNLNGALQYDLDATRLEHDKAQETIREIQMTLDAANAQQVEDEKKYLSKLSSVQKSLEAAQLHVEELDGKLASANMARDEVAQQLEVFGQRLDEAEVIVLSERNNVAALKTDLAVTREQLRGAEEEVEDLEQSKKADEATIAGLREGYAKLRAVHMESITELDDKIASAQSSPMPNKRRSSRFAHDRHV
ncbi:hypothetical protein SERLA73DRAFT_69517 [Serpula lacrymans var. lacrymans S7.3]|uniref:Uncharacterized protein n=1 Tax=Serpula lacrymans var. lacrymans (strain S7.3) TaxID=936435 RepID=F8PIN4_SERL3|nr:hypothetical protein SERLA73DRAFT_69517 [Serpula lacrymans var. lacrymans S7.3]